METPSEMDRSARLPDRATETSSTPASPAVVVGFDGSDSSWDALYWACGEARRLGGRTVAVFVAGAAGTGIEATASAMTGACFVSSDQLAREWAQQLRGQTKRFAANQGVHLSFINARGDAAAEILRIANAQHADQIVVGRSRKARHRLAGSLGRRLIGRRNAPVVVVVP
jgi:nucleotide-binding universal stress UspA family protein